MGIGGELRRRGLGRATQASIDQGIHANKMYRVTIGKRKGKGRLPHGSGPSKTTAGRTR